MVKSVKFLVPVNDNTQYNLEDERILLKYLDPTMAYAVDTFPSSHTEKHTGNKHRDMVQ